MKFVQIGLMSLLATLSYSIAVAATNQQQVPVFAENTKAKMLQSDTDKLSYALGVTTAQTFMTHGVLLNVAAFTQGFRDVVNHSRPALSHQQVQKIVGSFQVENQQEAAAKLRSRALVNLTASQKFLNQNKKKSDIISMKSGLQFKVIRPGVGEQPSANDVVVLDYEGKFINGEVFDSSYQRGRPASFPVNTVFKGWQEALKMMRPGAIWILYIPPHLAYGDHGAGRIGPNQALIYKIHLIAVKK